MATQYVQELGWRQWCVYCAVTQRPVMLETGPREEHGSPEDAVLAYVDHCSRVMEWKCETVKGKLGSASCGHALAGWGGSPQGDGARAAGGAYGFARAILADDSAGAADARWA